MWCYGNTEHIKFFSFVDELVLGSLFDAAITTGYCGNTMLAE